MSQVAEFAGVSQATVSFVLGGQADRLRISDETRQRVQSAASSLGYQRNQLARAMITGKSRIIGVLISPDAPENIARILAGAVEAASSHEYMVKIIHLSYSGVDDATISRCMEWRLAGAMVVGLNEQSTLLISDAFRLKGIDLVVIDNAPACNWGIRIMSADDQGIRDAVLHLVGLGHKRIAFLGGKPSALSTIREASFRRTMAEQGLFVPEQWVRSSSWGEQAIIEACVIDTLQPYDGLLPTGVVTSSDQIAMVTQRIARTMGLKLPEDLSVTGYSNTVLSDFADPALTTIEQPFYEMGQHAVKHLIQCAESTEIHEDEGHYPEMLIPTRLIVRKSTTVAPI